LSLWSNCILVILGKQNLVVFKYCFLEPFHVFLAEEDHIRFWKVLRNLLFLLFLLLFLWFSLHVSRVQLNMSNYLGNTVLSYLINHQKLLRDFQLAFSIIIGKFQWLSIMFNQEDIVIITLWKGFVSRKMFLFMSSLDFAMKFPVTTCFCLPSIWICSVGLFIPKYHDLASFSTMIWHFGKGRKFL